MVAHMGHNVRPKDKNFTGASAGYCSWSEGGVQRNSIDSAHVSKHRFQGSFSGGRFFLAQFKVKKSKENFTFVMQNAIFLRKTRRNGGRHTNGLEWGQTEGLGQRKGNITC